MMQLGFTPNQRRQLTHIIHTAREVSFKKSFGSGFRGRFLDYTLYDDQHQRMFIFLLHRAVFKTFFKAYLPGLNICE